MKEGCSHLIKLELHGLKISNHQRPFGRMSVVRPAPG